MPGSSPPVSPWHRGIPCILPGGLCSAEPRAAGVTGAKSSGHRGRSRNDRPGRGRPIPVAGQAVAQEQRARDVTSTAAVTRPGWLLFYKSQLISLAFLTRWIKVFPLQPTLL